MDLPPDKREFVPAHVTDIYSGLESAWSFKRRMDGLPYKKRRKRRRRDSDGELINPEEVSDDELDEAQEEEPASPNEEDEIDDEIDDDDLGTGEEKDELENWFQILDLHTKNPLVSYRGGIFSCEWASSIGTEMFFVKRSASDDDPLYEPMRSLNAWDLIGTSSARLLGSDATLVHRAERAPQEVTFATESSQAMLPEKHFLKRLVDIQVEKKEIEPDTIQFPNESNPLLEVQQTSFIPDPTARRGITVASTRKKRRNKIAAQTALGAHADRLGLLQDEVLDQTGTPGKWPDSVFREVENGEGVDSEEGP